MKRKPNFEKQFRADLTAAYKAAQDLVQVEFGAKVKLGDVPFMDLETTAEMLTEIAADIAYLRRRLAGFDKMKRG